MAFNEAPHAVEVTMKEILELARGNFNSIGNVIWLYYQEQMGILRILHAILDDFATRGQFALPGQGANADRLEEMVRLVNMGLSSRTRDRKSTYLRCLGWPKGAESGNGVATNDQFRENFEKLLQLALAFYQDKRLAYAITRQPDAPPSAATISGIAATIKALKTSFRPYELGRNYYNTLNGIAWVILTRDLIRDLRDALGIPTGRYNTPETYIPAAHALLLEGKPVGTSKPELYLYHNKAAEAGMEIVTGLELLNEDNRTDLETWLAAAETTIESYATATRAVARMRQTMT